MSEIPQREAQSGAGVASYWSGDANLQQTSVLGPGDGCDTKPEGNANEIRGVVADCYEGRPCSGGSSLGSRGTSPMPILPQTNTPFQLSKKPVISQEACCPPEESAFKGQSRCGKTDESEGLEENPGVAETTEATRRSSLVSTVSWFVQDAGRLLRDSPTILQQVRKEGLHPLGARLSSHVVALVRKSSVLSVVKDSQALSVVRRSFVFSLVKDSYVVSMVKDLPLVQHIQKEINQHLQLQEAAQIIQSCINSDPTQQTFSSTNKLAQGVQQVPEAEETSGLKREQHVADSHTRQGDQKPKNREHVQIAKQTLIEFPSLLLNMQNLPLPRMIGALQSVISPTVLASQKIIALYWLNVAKCMRPEPCPAVLLLLDAGLYVLTADSGLLVLFHHLPLVQLKEVQIGLAGLSLHLTGTTQESVLGVYTHSQTMTKELCCTLLGLLCPGDSRLSHHPLLHGDLMTTSLNWQASAPDLLLDTGLRVCSKFQKNLADLVYFLHCNMDPSGETVTLGDMQILLYVSVGLCVGPATHTKSLARLLLTETHLGLLQEDAVFHPAPPSATAAPCRHQFRDLTLRPRSDICRVLACDEDKHEAVRLDVILANTKGRGHPECPSETASPSAHPSNSSPEAEVWKLTFTCSTEAACLINHLSNV